MLWAFQGPDIIHAVAV